MAIISKKENQAYVQPIPPHCPYRAAPPVTGVVVGVGFTVVVGVVGVGVMVVGVVVGLTVVTPVPVGAPPGTTVGIVDGCRAVFQVAVVGYAVVAMVGTGVPYGVGPGTNDG